MEASSRFGLLVTPDIAGFLLFHFTRGHPVAASVLGTRKEAHTMGADKQPDSFGRNSGPVLQ